MRLSLCLLLCATQLPAADPPKAAPKPIVLRAARMFDGRSGSVTTPGLIVVTDNIITGIGPSAVIPADAETINFGDATLLPGFMDAHTHLSMAYGEDQKQLMIDGLRKNVAEQAL